MKSRKVLHVVNISFVLPYYFGDQFHYFREKGIEFHVACSPSEHLERYAQQKNFKIFPVAITRAISPLRDLRSLILLIGYIKKNEIDVVIGHTPKGGLLGMLAAWCTGINYKLYFRHGIVYETATGIKRFILKQIERLTGRLAQKVVCVSPSVLTRSNELGLSDPMKNILLRKGSINGIDLQKYNPVTDQDLTAALSEKLKLKGFYVVGYVGRLVRDKGIVALIDAWKILKDKNQNIKLLLVGPFEERDKLPSETVDFIKNEDSIVHIGFAEDPKPYYQLMDLFILPSYREGFPTVVLEASAMELPVITTSATGCCDSILPNKTGIFTTIQAEDIASKIDYYRKHPEIGKKHGMNGRLFVVENFKQENLWKELEENVYQCF